LLRLLTCFLVSHICCPFGVVSCFAPTLLGVTAEVHFMSVISAEASAQRHRAMQTPLPFLLPP
jgi:hypothetical protein